MIAAVIQSSVVLLVTLCALPALRRQSSALRHAVLTAGLVCAIAAPVISPLLPSWQVAEEMGVGPDRGGREKPQDAQRAQSIYVLHVPLVVSPFRPDPAYPHFLLTKRNAPATTDLVFRIWAGGVAIAAILILVGAARIAWLAFLSKPVVDERWTGSAREVSRSLNLKRRVRLLQNNGTAVLGTFGILRPRLLLPRAADSWPDDRLRIVLIHELAHIQRFDWLVQMLAELARAVYWFNPLFWILYRRLRIESERACDDVVLSLGIDASDYAAHLLELVRTLKNSGRTWAPVLAMAQPPDLERRFVAMLNPALNHRAASRAAMLAVCIVALAVTLPLAAMHAPEPAVQTVSVRPTVLVTASTPAPEKIAATAPKAAAAKSPATKPAAPQLPADGSLTGTVSDGTGAVIPGVTVTVSNRVEVNNGGRASVVETEVQATVSNQVGAFEFRSLQAGDYLIKAELPGFTTFRTSPIQVKPGQTLTQNVNLSVAGVYSQVTVTAAGQRKPAPFPGTPRRIRVGGSVSQANLVSQVKPIYPQSAKDAGIEGIVHLQGIIGTDGALIGLNALFRADADLTNAALEAVRQWRYKPTLLNNEPVEVVTTIDVEFRLSQ